MILFGIICLCLIFEALDQFLEFLNCKHMLRNRDKVPAGFEGQIDAWMIEKSCRYTVAKAKFSSVSELFDTGLALFFILGGILNAYNNLVLSMGISFVQSGALFFVGLTFAKNIVCLPFDYYGTFRIEKRNGFNTMTTALWLKDTLKKILLSTGLTWTIAALSLWIVRLLPDHWWLPVWAVLFLITLFALYLRPYLIEPLFNKFSPLEDEGLSDRIKELLSRAGLKVGSVLRMDASERTTHTNAYFSGIGGSRRIVLYDTLISRLTHEEILAVVAHEAGHWRGRHIIKMLALMQTIMLIATAAAFFTLKSDWLTRLFHIEQDSSPAKLVLLCFVGSLLLWPLSPLIHSLSRRFEREADDFACKLCGGGEALSSALVKLSKDNLSNLHPHPIYAFFNSSHPPATERVARIAAWRQ